LPSKAFTFLFSILALNDLRAEASWADWIGCKSMRKFLRSLVACGTTLFQMSMAVAVNPVLLFTKQWTYRHAENPGQVSEISAFDPRTNTLLIAGIAGVDAGVTGTRSVLTFTLL